MTVKRRKETKTPHVIVHRVADIRGGVSVKSSELSGDYLPEGALLSAPDSDGLCHVIKTAVVYAEAASSATEVKVSKFHNFAAGDFIAAKVGGTSVTISKVDSSASAYDVITLSATLGALSAGKALVEAKAAGSSAALKNTPVAVVGTGKPVISGVNIDTDAWLIAVTKGLALPDGVELKGVINY